MATISSAGIGSGLDVNSIVSQLVALEKQPLKSLELKATNVKSQISSMAQIKSQFSALTDVASRLSTSTAWSGRTAVSSNTSAATISVTGTANAATLTLDVDQLALQQSVSSVTIAKGTAVGAGTLTFDLGTWSGIAASTASDATATAIAAASAGSKAVSQVTAVKTALSSFAAVTPSAAAYSTAYSTWATAVAANDHATPALQAIEDAALVARDSAYSDLGIADPAAQTAADGLATSATAAADLASFALGTTAATDYSDKYTAWVAAVAGNDGVTQTLIDAQAAALLARDDAHTALSVANPTVQAAADVITGAATPTTATSSVAAWKLAAETAALTAAPRPTFAAGSSGGFSIDVTSTDTVATLAVKINAMNGGVVATAFNDGTNDRLLLSSKTTGAASGFRVQASGSADGTNADNSGLSRVAFDPAAGAFGMASVGLLVQEGGDARAHINGLEVTSASNTLTDNIPGVTINLLAKTTVGSPVTMRISEDVTPASKSVTEFVNAYNALYANLADLTKYDASKKTAGLFQGDSTLVGMQNLLRSMAGSTSMGTKSQRLADIGIEQQRDGSLAINTAKLSIAANDGISLQQLFTKNNNDPLTDGFAIKFRNFGRGVASTDGFVSTKTSALDKQLANNVATQAKVNARATLFETRIRRQYTALDVQMSQLTALNAYVSQQVTLWNKSTA